MWLLFKHANKIHILHFIAHFHVPIFNSLNHREYTPTPAIPSNARLDPYETPKLIVHILRFFNALHLNQGHGRAPQHFGKWVKGGRETTFLFMAKV
jgi:hypothetical protein